jgi:hypothetical protein
MPSNYTLKMLQDKIEPGQPIFFTTLMNDASNRVLIVKWLERPTFISMFRGSNPGLVMRIFLQYFIISATLAPSGPLSGESTFHYHQS